MSDNVVSTTTKSLFYNIDWRDEPVDVNDSLILYRSQIRTLGDTFNLQSFDKFLEYLHDFVTIAYPSSPLCDYKQFSEGKTLDKTLICFNCCFQAFQYCARAHDNPTLDYFCDFCVRECLIHFQRWLKDFHKLEYKQLPHVYELIEKCFKFWIECRILLA